jgi:hypothetical protein
MNHGKKGRSIMMHIRKRKKKMKRWMKMKIIERIVRVIIWIRARK